MNIWTEYVRVVSAAYGWLYGVLAAIGTELKNVLTQQPLWCVRVALALLFLALAIWCIRLSKEYVMEGARRQTWWNDPRRWAVAVLAIQIVLYLSL